MSVEPTEEFCEHCKKIRSKVHQCYDAKPKPMLDMGQDERGPWYGYRRGKYKIVPDKDKSSEDYEAFRIVEK